MADIDKSLPNVRHEIEIPPAQAPTDVDITEQPRQPVEVTPDEEGGATVNFEPSSINQAQSNSHFDNLADILPEEVLDPVGLQIRANYTDYKMSRKDWEQSYVQGLDLLGFKYDNRSEPFQGASGATHPVLAEAVTQFQALAYKYLLPAEGPVRTQLIGLSTPDKEAQALRVKEFMNYQLMSQMPEYEAEFDQMLFYLPLAGSAFKKVYYDEIMQRAVSKFVPAEDIVVPYTATSLDDCESIIHKERMTENDLRKQQVGGFYKDIEVDPSYLNETDSEKAQRELEGTTKGRDQKIFTLLECHVNIDLEGFEDLGQDETPTGIKLPYIVTLEEGTRKILSIRRNFAAEDMMKD